MCEIVKSTAGGKDFFYCREHKSESVFETGECDKVIMQRLNDTALELMSTDGGHDPIMDSLPSMPIGHNFVMTDSLQGALGCSYCGCSMMDMYKPCV